MPSGRPHTHTIAQPGRKRTAELLLVVVFQSSKQKRPDLVESLSLTKDRNGQKQASDVTL
jgi:hypothetical protein